VSFIRLGIFVLAAATMACGDSAATDTVPGPGAPAIERSVAPSATGAGITNSTGQHFVVAPGSSNRSGKLLVFLPGTGGRPDFYRSILRHATGRAHHAIGLAYPNAEAVNDLCASAPSPTCHEDARVEVITGAPRSALVAVDVANSIENRLRALLSWLDLNFPAEGWSAFLANGSPRWDRVMVAGHSQGGGHAAMIARLRVVDRGILFAATEPAAWTTTPFATAPAKLYGFVHRLEPAFTGITASWRLMDMPGPITSVDGAAPPFAGSHQLETNVGTCRPFPGLDTPHNCVVVDAITPIGLDGQPTFAAVWTYLLER
jgi:hypothetical protein